MNGRPWTDQQIAFLRRHAGRRPYAAIAADLGRSESSGNSDTNIKQAVIVQEHGGTLAPLPPPPTKALPGSPGKIEVLARRVANGQALAHEEDAR